MTGICSIPNPRCEDAPKRIDLPRSEAEQTHPLENAVGSGLQCCNLPELIISSRRVEIAILQA